MGLTQKKRIDPAKEHNREFENGGVIIQFFSGNNSAASFLGPDFFPKCHLSSLGMSQNPVAIGTINLKAGHT